jgi:hypothetical protein
MAREAGQLAVYSFVITLINIVCICLMAVIVLRIKKVIPIIPDNEIGDSSSFLSHFSGAYKSVLRFSARFWHSDMEKIHAGSNDKVHNEMDGENAEELINIVKTVGSASALSKQDSDYAV